MSGHSVIVVGAGVSGCACAAELAGRGYVVTLVNGSLDSVGMPGYGPEVLSAEDGLGTDAWRALLDGFEALSPPMRRVWLGGALVASGNLAMLVLDRRRVSVDTKWVLEGMKTLRIRQGLVTSVRPALGGARGIEVETVFGEVLNADACVLAVGLALGGIVTLGGHEFGGGRYAEVPADALRDSLLGSGVALRATSARVGARLRVKWEANGRSVIPAALPAARGESPDGGVWRAMGLISAGEAATGMSLQASGLDGGSAWRGRLLGSAAAAAKAMEAEEEAVLCRPPSPYRPGEGRVAAQGDRSVVFIRMVAGGVSGVVAPDGLATAEWYASPGLAVAATNEEMPPGACLSDAEVREAAPECGPDCLLGGGTVRGTGVGAGTDGGSGSGIGCGSGTCGTAWVVTRPEHAITSVVLDGVDRGGPVPGLEGAWVCGQAAGCRSYLESLVSGATVGRMVAEKLG